MSTRCVGLLLKMGSFLNVNEFIARIQMFESMTLHKARQLC